MSEPLSALERVVIDKLLEGDLEQLRALRAQLTGARVVRREWTGVGFWTDFKVSEEGPRPAMRARCELTGVYLTTPALGAGAGFSLSIEGGRLRSLEGYTFDEPWPSVDFEWTLRLEPTGDQRLLEIANCFAPSEN